MNCPLIFLTANFTNFAKLAQVFFVLPLREIHKSGRFDCPGAGLGESDKSFLRYRRLRAMDWFMLTQGLFTLIAVNCSLIFFSDEC